MNKQELIEEIEDLKELKQLFGNDPSYIRIDTVMGLVSKLNEPQPLRLKDVIARIKCFDLGTKAVWLNEILYKLGSDYGLHKYYAGYKQGKLDSAMERKKVIIPQFVADWIKYCKNTNVTLVRALLVEEVDLYNYANQKDSKKLKEFLKVKENQEIFARAWLDGYELEKEKRYTVKMKDLENGFNFLNFSKEENHWLFSSKDDTTTYRSHHTRKELEQAGFGWVFDCEGIEIEEVTE